MAPPGGGKAFRVQLPSLTSGPLPLQDLREQARISLLDVIDARRGARKALLLDASLSGPLTCCLDPHITQLLAEHGVTRIHYLDDRPLDDPLFNPPGADDRLLDLRSVLWLVRPTVINAQRVAQQVKSLRSRPGAAGQAPDLCICFVPRQTIACNRVLEDEGVWGDVVVCEWPLEVMALEDDVLSLELDGAFKECVLEGDSSSLYYMSRAIIRIQAMWGLIPRLQGKGPAAVAVKDMVLRMRRENPNVVPAPSDPAVPPRIGRVILLDREVDVVTPCMTQITFEGLIDEVTGIKGGAVMWAPKDKRTEAAIGGTTHVTSAHAPSSSTAGMVSTLLNSTDPFYKEFRDLPYHIAISRLQTAARDARREYDVLAQKDLAQLKTFVKGLPKLMLLDRLSDIATPVADQVRQQHFHDRLKAELDAVEGVDQEACLTFAQELIFRGSGLLEVLRLLVLLTVTAGGLPKRAFDSLREDILVAYGHEHACTLAALEKAGLLHAATSGRSPFSLVRKVLKLVVPESEGSAPDSAPTDVAHLYRGYAPLSIRLVEAALSPAGWGKPGGSRYETLSLLPGATFDVMQPLNPNDREAATHSSGAQPGPHPAGGRSSTTGVASHPQSASGTTASGGQQDTTSTAAGEPAPREVVLVVFLGGVTYSEISALRWLSSRGNMNFLILTTQVVNGRTLLAPFVEPLLIASTGGRSGSTR